MKRAIIVHCWGGTPNYCWYPTVKHELEKQDFVVEVPAMPETDEPKLKLWLPKLQETIGEPSEELYLIGHSAGCVTIMRYLEQLPEGTKIGGIVLVAGFTDNLGFDELSNFFQTPLDVPALKNKLVNVAVLIHSDDDPYVPVSFGEELRDNLGGELVVLHGLKHMSGPVDNEDSCDQLPSVIEAITKLSPIRSRHTRTRADSRALVRARGRRSD